MPALYSLRPGLGSASKTAKVALTDNAVRAARSEFKGRDDNRTLVMQAGKIPAPPAPAAAHPRRGLFDLRLPQAMQFQPQPQQQQPQPQPCAEPSKQQVAYRLGDAVTASNLKPRPNGVDILKRMSSTDYSSSGSAHEINSVCLAEMVHEFLEDEAQFGPCGRARCNCGSGTCGDFSATTDAEDSSVPSLGGEQSEILCGLLTCVSDFENHVLTAVNSTVRAVSDEPVLVNGGENSPKSTYRVVMSRLRAAGFNAAICKSRWEHTGGVPGGDYEYIDVVSEAFGAKSERMIVDLDFKTQFEIARPSVQYKAVLAVVPNIFVGKADRLLQVLNVLCDAMRRSVKKKGMPLPPWRKPEYIKAKWFSLYKRTTNASSSTSSSSSKDGDVGGVILRGPRWDPRFTTELETNFNRAADMRKVLRDSNGLKPVATAATVVPFKKQEATTTTAIEPEGVVRGARLMMAEMQKVSKSDAIVKAAAAAAATAAEDEWEPPAVNYSVRSRRAARKGTSMLAAIFTEGGKGARLQDEYREPCKPVFASGGALI